MSESRAHALLIGTSAVFLVVILVVAVGSSAEADLDGTSWQVESLVVDGSMVAAIEGSGATISFDDGAVGGSGGCNTYFGSYEASDGELSIGELGSTQMFCEETSDQEFAFLGHLATVDSYRIAGGELILSDGSTDLVVLSALDT